MADSKRWERASGADEGVNGCGPSTGMRTKGRTESEFGGRLRATLAPAVLACSLFGVGCVRQPDVASDQLPLRRVVIYRNGVAYFERGGTVDEEEVRFKLRQRNVGDFLATLAIVEKGGSSVRAASFPVEIEEEDEEPIDPAMRAALDAWDRQKSGQDPRELRDVTLELDGEEHDLAVGYLAETPLWRPSYRLVVGADGQADLQAWGIVQNQSGEDWKDVRISLVAGAPIAFESTLGDPVTPPRPVVTDTGEVIAAVPDSVTTYHQAEEEEEAAEEAARDDEDRAEAGKKRASKASVAPGRAPRPAPPPALAEAEASYGAADAVGAGAPAPSAVAPSAPRDMSRLAAVQVQAGSTRYDVPHTVTIPDQSATMVLLVSQKVPGEAVYLYAPDGGVPDSMSHPFRVARFTNASKGLLEKGPIAVFEQGAFLGQGMMESLPAKARTTVPFALVRGMGVEQKRRYDQRGARLYSIENGELEVERDQTTITTYTVQNGLADAAKLLVKHPRQHGAKLFEPPPGTEDNVGQGSALIPVQVPAHGKAELVVDERQPFRSRADWMSDVAASAVRKYIEDPRADQRVVLQLRAAFQIREDLRRTEDQVRKLKTEQAELEKATRETRLSIQAIEKNTRAADLRRRLTERLAKNTARLDEITKELIELGMKRDELEVRFRDAARDINLPPQD